jgi:1,4-dihydroxy-6-naphthoate synthase
MVAQPRRRIIAVPCLVWAILDGAVISGRPSEVCASLIESALLPCCAVQIRLGHSPDPDDAFMFWALASGEVDARGFEFEHVLKDIQTLNEWALEGRLEVSAISLHTYPFVQDRYVLLPHGASMGHGYGPIVVAQEALSKRRLSTVEIAVPGRMTTAFLVLRMYLGDFRYREVPFDQIIGEVQSGRAEAGLLIHEGQLTYAAEGLAKVVDLGE